MKLHSGGYTTAQREQALREAEENLVRPGSKDARELLLHLEEIKTHPVLFQPRSFLSARVYADEDTAQDVDVDWVDKLKRRIGTSGELDPIIVVRLRVLTEPDVYTGERTLLPPAWIIVDGHHRHAAYGERGWEKPLKCLWFAGSARDAMDTAGRSSTVLKLEASREDREEEVWKRVLIGEWTREQLRRQWHVSPNLIARMRKVIRWHGNKTVRTKARHEFLKGHKNLKNVSWCEAHLAYLGAGPAERTDEQRKQSLALQLRTRFDPNSHRSLSREPTVTAGALAIYDKRLPGELTQAWEEWRPSEAIERFRNTEAREDLADAGKGGDGDLEGPEDPEDLEGLGEPSEGPAVEEGPRSVQRGGCIRYNVSLSACTQTHFSVGNGVGGW